MVFSAPLKTPKFGAKPCHSRDPLQFSMANRAELSVSFLPCLRVHRAENAIAPYGGCTRHQHRRDPRARAMLGASEIAYAVDAQAASIRETLATLYLSILPAGVGCIAGAVSFW